MNLHYCIMEYSIINHLTLYLFLSLFSLFPCLLFSQKDFTFCNVLNFDNFVRKLKFWISTKVVGKGPGGSPAVGGRELSWAYFNLKTVLTLPNYNLVYTYIQLELGKLVKFEKYESEICKPIYIYNNLIKHTLL